MFTFSKSVCEPNLTVRFISVFNLYNQYRILSNVNAMTAYLDKELSELVLQKTVIKEVRGLGLMKGIELFVPATSYIKALQELGIIVIPSGTHVIRLLPPLIVQKEHIDMLVQALRKIL